MAEQEFNPTALLGGYLKETDPDQAVKLARELCSQLEGDPESFHGAVWPGNVDLDVDGKAVLGPGSHTPASERPADQVEYLAPEFFWDGSGSAAADVYSVGLLLYAGCNGGYLPFQPRDGELTDKARSDALRRRMKGEAITAPEGVSDELKKVMEKALAYEPEDRYITAKELLTAIGRTDEALPAAEAAGVAAAGIAAAGVAAAAAADGEAPTADGEAPEAAQDSGPEPQDQEPAAESAPQEAPAEEKPDQDAPAGEDEAKQDAFVFGDEPEKDDKAAAAAAAVAGAAVAGAAVMSAGKKKNAKKGAAEAKNSGRVQSVAASGAKHAASGGARPQYKVQKDFEGTPRAQRRGQSVVPASQKRKKRSKAIPVLCGVAAAVILGSVGYGLLSRKNPVESDLYTPEDNIEAPAPVVVTIAPTEEPSPSPRPTPRPTSTPAPTPEVVLDAEGNVIAVIGGTGAGTSATTGTGTATGTGTGTTTGTGAGSGTGSGTGTTSSGSGTGSSGSGSGWSGGGSSSGGNSGWSGGGSSSGGNSGWSGGGSSSGGSSGSGSGSSSGGSSSNGGYSGPVDAANDTVYITGNLLRVRRGPGLNYAVFGWVNVGDKLPRTGTVNGWSQVKYQGQVGYVSNDYVTTNDPSATPTPVAPPAITASPSPTPAPTPTPTASPVPTPTYTATAEDKKYSDLQDTSLATIASQEEMDAVVEALGGNGSLRYAWVSATKESDGWKSGGTAISASFWKEGHPVDGNDWALLEKQEDGTWKLISVKSEGFDAASDTYKGKIGYVTKTTA